MDHFSYEEMIEIAIDEHAKSKIKYEIMLKDNDVIELRRLLILNDETSKDTITNLLMPDNIRTWYGNQVSDILENIDLSGLFNSQLELPKYDRK